MVIKTLLKTVDAGSTTLTFTDSDCTDDMIYDVYVDDIAVLPTNVTVVNHTVTVNFKEAQTSAVQVKIVINALEGSLDASDIPYDATDTSLTADNVEDAIDELDTNISHNVGDIEQLQLDMVQAQSDIAGKADLFAVDDSLSLSEGVLSTEASIIPFDNSLIGIVSEDVQGAIEEVFQSVSDGKVLIADAITDKGVPTSASDSFSTMATNIGQITGGGGGKIHVLDVNDEDVLHFVGYMNPSLQWNNASGYSTICFDLGSVKNIKWGCFLYNGTTPNMFRVAGRSDNALGTMTNIFSSDYNKATSSHLSAFNLNQINNVKRIYATLGWSGQNLSYWRQNAKIKFVYEEV